MAADPVFTGLWIAVTIGVYSLMLRLYRRANSFSLMHPVITSSALIIGLLAWSGADYLLYRAHTELLHDCLELATIAIAIPLFRERHRLRALAIPLLTSLSAATALNLCLAYAIGSSLQLLPDSLIALLSKSVTTPVAIGITELSGGSAALTAAVVITTGIIGAMFGPLLLRYFQITDPVARGVAMGTLAHGVGTAKAFQMSPVSGAFAGLSMALCAIITSLVLPTIINHLGI
ncbi:MAG: LrgB family protein [Proteobacteria bacterium]|nr:LrgB family protein [Pseudomonadota bacterium]